MAETTPNIGLRKPLDNDSADIAVINQNMDRIDLALGDMASVPTTAKDAAGAISELFTNVSDGKAAVAAAITDKGIPTAASDTFSVMADHIAEIETGVDTSDATAVAGDILASKTAYGLDGKLFGTLTLTGNTVDADVLATKTYYSSDAKTKRTGTMTNNGTVNVSLISQNQEFKINSGYHSGNGKVTVNISNLTAPNIANGINVGGIVGTGPSYMSGNSIPFFKLGGSTTLSVATHSYTGATFSNGYPVALGDYYYVILGSSLQKRNIYNGTLINSATIPGNTFGSFCMVFDPTSSYIYVGSANPYTAFYISKFTLSNLSQVYSVTHSSSYIYSVGISMGNDGTPFIWAVDTTDGNSPPVYRLNSSTGAIIRTVDYGTDSYSPGRPVGDSAGNSYTHVRFRPIFKYNSSGNVITSTASNFNESVTLCGVDEDTGILWAYSNGMIYGFSISNLQQIFTLNVGGVHPFSPYDQVTKTMCLLQGYNSSTTANTVNIKVFNAKSLSIVEMPVSVPANRSVNATMQVGKGNVFTLSNTSPEYVYFGGLLMPQVYLY